MMMIQFEIFFSYYFQILEPFFLNHKLFCWILHLHSYLVKQLHWNLSKLPWIQLNMLLTELQKVSKMLAESEKNYFSLLNWFDSSANFGKFQFLTVFRFSIISRTRRAIERLFSWLFHLDHIKLCESPKCAMQSYKWNSMMVSFSQSAGGNTIFSQIFLKILLKHFGHRIKCFMIQWS